MSRPEHQAPAEVYYDSRESKKYASSSRMIEIQSTMSERAIELLALPDDGIPKLLLDVGCGSGLSGNTISESGHQWVGVDISPDMLSVAKSREVEGDLNCLDMGHGMPFRMGSFDGAISISAIQWLCAAHVKSHVPHKRLARFFATLYQALRRGSRAVFQFYPETSGQVELITSAAMRCGFSGGLVVDYPNSTKAKKYYLCLFAGAPSALPRGLDSDMDTEGMVGSGSMSMAPQEMRVYGGDVADKPSRRRGKRHGAKRATPKSKQWIQNKKESQRKKFGAGKVRHDSKFTARPRSGFKF